MGISFQDDAGYVYRIARTIPEIDPATAFEADEARIKIGLNKLRSNLFARNDAAEIVRIAERIATTGGGEDDTNWR